MLGPWSWGTHPEQQQRPGHHCTEQEDDALSRDDVILGALLHVQEGPGKRLCKEGVLLRALARRPHPRHVPTEAPHPADEKRSRVCEWGTRMPMRQALASSRAAEQGDPGQDRHSPRTRR